MIGAVYQGNNECFFKVWAPRAEDIKLGILYPAEKILQLDKDQDNYWIGRFENISPGTGYKYIINSHTAYPDPASNYQPQGVHGPSEVVDHLSFDWKDRKRAIIPLEDYIIYEMHVGTFTSRGTFVGAISRIPHLKDLGITAVEIMPVAQFPGNRNWGYDGVYPFAPQSSYGGPAGLKQLVNELHKNDIAVILDVVYNHLGPEGNYTTQFAPYFTSKHHTIWGDALNFDDDLSGGVRNYFIQNALYWLRTYHFDGLRLDAIDKIFDDSPKHFLKELAENVDALSSEINEKKILIAESDLNDKKIIRGTDNQGYGIDAQWNDDFHHSLHSVITGEKNGYYIDFGSVRDLAKCLNNNFVYDGVYSGYRKKVHGGKAADMGKKQFVVYIQNHDQVGNRARGERISSLISFELYKAVSAIVLLSPFIPMLFMGEELYDDSPFHYFISHSDTGLINAVRDGRRKEFHLFNWDKNVPDPYAEKMFLDSKINWDLLSQEKSRTVYNLYKKLIDIRKAFPLFKEIGKDDIEVRVEKENKILMVRFLSNAQELVYLVNFKSGKAIPYAGLPLGNWKKILDTSDNEWLGPGELPVKAHTDNKDEIVINQESFTLFESEK